MLSFKFTASFFFHQFYIACIYVHTYIVLNNLYFEMPSKEKIYYSYIIFEGNKTLTERDWSLRKLSSAAHQEAPSHNLQNHFLCHLSRNFLPHSSEHSGSECSLDIHKWRQETRVPCSFLEGPKLHMQGLQLPTPGKKTQRNHNWHWIVSIEYQRPLSPRVSNSATSYFQ